LYISSIGGFLFFPPITPCPCILQNYGSGRQLGADVVPDGTITTTLNPSSGYPALVRSTSIPGVPSEGGNMIGNVRVDIVKGEAVSPTDAVPPESILVGGHVGGGGSAVSSLTSPGATSPTTSVFSGSPSPPGGSGYGFRPRRTVFSSSQPLGTHAATKNLAFERQQQQAQHQQQQVGVRKEAERSTSLNELDVRKANNTNSGSKAVSSNTLPAERIVL
jgi:hypothetical protein